MTTDEIKASYTMRDIVSKYGFTPNRSGFIRCPFHSGDNDPSMKIYASSFHCYACGADGDAIDFVQQMEKCDFKTAFRLLGGDFNPLKNSDKLRIRREQSERKNKELKLMNTRAKYHVICRELIVFRKAVLMLEPMSDCWCYAYNKMQIYDYKADLLQDEINKLLEKR